MKIVILIILIAFHLIGSSLNATKVFLKKDHIDSHIDRCDIHEHQHSHHGSTHQHKHSHSQSNMNSLDFFTDTKNINPLKPQKIKETYLDTLSWIPNSTLESLFRPPKI